MNTGSKDQRSIAPRTSLESVERTSAVPTSTPSRGLSLTDSSRESGDFFISRGPKSGTRPRSPESHLRPSSILLETPYAKLELDHRHGFVRFTRSEKVFSSIADIEHEGRELARALERTGKTPLLVDLRAAAPRNDPEFEEGIRGFRRKLFERRERAAVLVRTAVGALQVKRHMREDGFDTEVFQSEEEAIHYLEAGAPESYRRITSLPPPPSLKFPLRGR